MGAVADEPVEIIDERGTVIAVVRRAEMRAGNLRHRNIAVFVQRGDGRLVVHQRADWKDVYPSAWDIAFGGVPGVGEPDGGFAVGLVHREGLHQTCVDDRCAIDAPPQG